MPEPASGERAVHLDVRFGPDGRPLGASARTRIPRPVREVWATVSDVEGWARQLPMVRKATRRGDELTLELGFKVAFFSVGFAFSARARRQDEEWLELSWTAGEPRDIVLRLALTPADDGRACDVESAAQFDLMSIGWLAKYFLRHHPEIQLGVFPGVTIALLEALRRNLPPSEVGTR
jgi:hypothetical protein